MNNTLKFILIFIGSGAVMFLIFYFYPAKIFDVELISPPGAVIESQTEEIHLQGFLGWDERHKEYLEMYGYTQERKLSGWMILLIMSVGLPAMFAYRGTISKQAKSEDETTEQG